MTTEPTAAPQLPRSPSGGLMYCAGGCGATLWVPRGGVKLCPDCRAAAELAATDESEAAQ